LAFAHASVAAPRAWSRMRASLAPGNMSVVGLWCGAHRVRHFTCNDACVTR
jgi:hypothetical protein